MRGELAKAALQLPEQTFEAKAGDLPGRQFQRQRDAIEATADIDDPRQIGISQFEAVVAGHGPFDEELQRGKIQGLGAVQHGDGRGAVQGLQALNEFAFSPQALAAGGQDVQMRRATQQAFTQQRHAVDQVLAIVDDQQHLAFTQEHGEVVQGFCIMQGQLEQRRQMTGDHRRIVDRRQVQQANSVPIATDQLFGDPQRHGGLADPAGADQGDETLARQVRHQAVDQRLPADHAGAAQGQVMAARFDRLAWPVDFDVLQRVRRDKTVATLGHGDDIALTGLTVPQRLAQGGHVHPQVDFFHHAVGPDFGHQVLLADHIPGVLQQDQQDIHGPPAQAQGAVGLHHQALSGVDPVGSEMDSLLGGKGQRFTPGCIRLVRGFRTCLSGYYPNAMHGSGDCMVPVSTAAFASLLPGPVLIGLEADKGAVEAFGAPGKINNV